MTNLELGFWSFPVLLLMIFLRAPIGLAMLLCGFGGWYLAMGGNPTPLLSKLKSETYTTFSSYSLSIIPMFLLMGQFATLSGMSQALFKAAESFLGHRRGGVAMAAVGACAGFGAICGSSLATAATMSKVALPELRRFNYSGSFVEKEYTYEASRNALYGSIFKKSCQKQRGYTVCVSFFIDWTVWVVVFKVNRFLRW